MVLEHLRSSLGPVTLAHGPCPDTPRNATDHRVLGIHAVGEKETQMRCKLVNFHAPREVVLNNCKPIGQRERELADRVRTSFCDVISADRNAVIIAHAVIDEELLYVAHHFHRKFSREDAGILRLVFLENVSLYRAADRCERLFADARKSICIDYLVTGYAQQAQSQAIVSRWQVTFVMRLIAAIEVFVNGLFRGFPLARLTQMFFNLLIDGCIHEERKNHGCRSVDGHRH